MDMELDGLDRSKAVEELTSTFYEIMVSKKVLFDFSFYNVYKLFSNNRDYINYAFFNLRAS